MIVQLTGTLVSVTLQLLFSTLMALSMSWVYQLHAALPQAGEAGVTVLTRMVVREDSMELL